MRLVFHLLLTSLLVSCSTRSSLNTNYPENKKVTISSVPFITQDEYQCGPASLAMVFQHLGKRVTATEVSSQVFSPGRKGSLQIDMISSVRRHGLISTPLNTLDEIFAEIDEGNPVLILQNLALDWFPRWHYAVVLGYDHQTSEMILHSGRSANLRMSYFTFEKTWKRAKNWGLVIVNPGKIPVSAEELDLLKSSAHLEKVNLLKEAAASYQAILRKWPKSMGAMIGLGNVYYTQKYYVHSVNILKRALEIYPDSDAVLNNYSIAKEALVRITKK